MGIQLTEAALGRVREFLKTDASAVALRFGVRRTGCSGWAYEVDLTDRVAEGDSAFEVEGVRVVVDAKSLPIVDGTLIDFEKRGITSSFVFRNPNASAECGCGESFTVDSEHAA